jgi:hypothetical protein
MLQIENARFQVVDSIDPTAARSRTFHSPPHAVGNSPHKNVGIAQLRLKQQPEPVEQGHKPEA